MTLSLDLSSSTKLVPGNELLLNLTFSQYVYADNMIVFQVWDLATDKVGWVGAACRATMVGHMHTVRCLQVHVYENLVCFCTTSNPKPAQANLIPARVCHLHVASHIAQLDYSSYTTVQVYTECAVECLSQLQCFGHCRYHTCRWGYK